MRFAPLLVVIVLGLAACSGPAKAPTLPKPAPAIPADDITAATKDAQHSDNGKLAAKDPRVVDLDIIRITATSKGVGDHEATSVATTDLFREANEAAKAGRTQEAMTRYRQLVSDFPESLYAPISLFNIAAILDGQGDYPGTVAALLELVKAYPTSRESIEGHLYVAALQADHKDFAAASTTLDNVLARTGLTFADRVEAFARQGYVELEQKHYDKADTVLKAAVDEWRKAPQLDDVYYIAMAHYYRGESLHRRFLEQPIGPGDDKVLGDLEQKRVLAGKAYDLWRDSLGFHHAYWATAAGYQMSQIFVELWEQTVTAPYPTRLEPNGRQKYLVDVHDKVREHLDKALEGHRANVELAKAYGVDTEWSKASEARVILVKEMIARDMPGTYVTPSH